jgi:GntR family transcriptional regulator
MVQMDTIESSKTHRLYVLLKERITSGALTTGQRLPSEPDLAINHGLSRVTVRRALDGLEQDGLIRRQAGAGTFVLDVNPNRAVVADLSNMLAHLVAMGRATRVHLLDFGYEKPPAGIAEALRIGPIAKTQRSVRIRYLDDTPFSHLTTYVPEEIGLTYTESDLATTPLLSLLERSGIVANKASQTISATLAGPEISQRLQVEVGSPLISLTRVVFDVEGRGVEHLSAFYRPDMHAFEMELNRTGRGAERRWSPVAKPIPSRKLRQPSTDRVAPTIPRRTS